VRIRSIHGHQLGGGPGHQWHHCPANLPCFQNDPVDTVNSETASNADDDRWGYDEEENDFDPDILEDDEGVDEEACDEDNESTVEEQPGENQ